MNYELNRFFDDCFKEVKNNKEKLQAVFPITNEDIKSLKLKQPEINVAELTVLIAETAGYHKVPVERAGKTTLINKYDKPFDNLLTSLWFCFYRFFYIQKLSEPQYYDIACHIVYESFFRVMKYIKVDEMSQGSQITALLYLVLHSATEDLRRTQLPKLKGVESLNRLNSNLMDPDNIVGSEDLSPEENLALLIERMIQLYPNETDIINELKLIQKGEKGKLSVKNHKRLKVLADSKGE